MVIEEFPKKLTLSIPFDKVATASLIHDVLSVDRELKASVLRRSLHLDDNKLIVNFESTDYKLLRVASNAFLKNTLLTLKTINKFGGS